MNQMKLHPPLNRNIYMKTTLRTLPKRRSINTFNIRSLVKDEREWKNKKKRNPSKVFHSYTNLYLNNYKTTLNIKVTK